MQVLLAFALVPLYLISWLIPRKKHIWVFGNRKGFVDNPRYLFETASRRSNIKVVWLAHAPELARSIRQQGYSSEYKYSLRGIAISARAAVGVVCNGLNDLNRWTSGRMRVVQLWHGIPLKKIKLDYAPHAHARLSRTLDRVLMRMSFWLQRRLSKRYDLVIASSPIDAQRLSTGLGVSKSKVRILGSPRNAVILGSHFSNQRTNCDRPQYQCAMHEHTFLFAPTWREAGVEYDWWRDFNIAEWETALKDTNSILLIKAHPFSRHDVNGNIGTHRIRWIDSAADVNSILPNINLLISDYSSIIYDFALLGRPIVFFAPDLDLYSSTRGMYEPYADTIQGQHCSSWDEVLHTIRNVLTDPAIKAQYIERALLIRERHHRYTDGGDCSRILGEVERLILGR